MGKKRKKSAESAPNASKKSKKAGKELVGLVPSTKESKSGKSKSGKSGKPDYKDATEVRSVPPATDLFRLRSGLVDLKQLSTIGPNQPFDELGPQNKDEAVEMLSELGATMKELQEKLFAESVAGKTRSVLVVLQGMDTAGKDGVIDHVIGQLNPGAIRLASFKRPTADELSHDFLWRIEKQVPAPGLIGVFNRSHYEDVLIQRVHNIVPPEVWGNRYASINAFESSLTRRGVKIVKCFLHVSKDVQRERLVARLDDPTKYWKFNPADIDERGYWDDYQTAYTAALAKCSTVDAPWHVIPADRKWYRNWAIGALLTQTLIDLDPHYPDADFDVEEQRLRLAKG